MSRTECPRSFEAEARRDGRLSGVERASFERHLATCPSCTREVEALEALAAPLRDDTERDVDELHERRERTRLLAAFERSRLTPEVQALGVRRALLPALAAALSVLALGVFLFVRSRSGVETAAFAVIQARGAATWSRHVGEGSERVVLRDGTLRIQREQRAGSPRLVVILPDGELEDIGTTFTVSASNGRTTHVSVEEGRVVVRLRGKAPVALGRGGVFTAEEPPAPPARTTSVEPSASTGPVVSAPPRVQSPPPRAAGSEQPQVAVALSATPDDAAARDFRAATSALDAGDNARAAAAFARFLAQNGRDARAEDAAYLRVIALQRAGNADAMRRAASEYLRRYPSGFRRAEVEALVGD